jgi:hypothetical protein
MTSPETIEAFRRMTPGERLKLTIQAIREATPYLFEGPPEVVARRFQRLRDEKNARNRAIRETLDRANQNHESD